MSGLVLPFKNGTVRFTDDAWCRISVEIEGIVRNFGCDIQYDMYKTILTNMSKKDDVLYIINGETVQFLINLSDPHCYLYISQTLRKIILMPDAPEGRHVYKEDGITHIDCEFRSDNKAYAMAAELSDRDYKTWLRKLKKALPTAKDLSHK